MNTDLLATVTQISDIGIAALGILVVVISFIGALQSGVLGRKANIPEKSILPEKSKTLEVAIKKASSTVPSSPAPGIIPGAMRAPETAADDEAPYETEQLENYYSQVLVQSKISFWFSLVFASIGFLIIVLAAFLHSTAAVDSTIARFIAGGVVDAVAALFFVQSKRAQESMAEFFDKLRRDRNQLEARKLCESLESSTARDALRVRLALHYAEVESPDVIAESIIKAVNAP